ncbi:hypothetical protein [Streptomyces sp. NPDC002587]
MIPPWSDPKAPPPSPARPDTATAVRFAYGDGRRDAESQPVESLRADPVTGRFHAAGKVVGAARRLYRAPLPRVTGQVNTAPAC